MRLCGILLVGLLLPTPLPRVQQVQLPARKTLTLEAARRVAAAAEAEAKRNNWAVSIAGPRRCRASGRISPDGRREAGVAIDVAIRKARTAVYFQGPTKGLEQEVSGGRTALLPIEGFMPLEGGVPLIVDSVLVGAVGVSGVTGAQDGQCAQAGATVLTQQSR